MVLSPPLGLWGGGGTGGGGSVLTKYVVGAGKYSSDSTGLQAAINDAVMAGASITTPACIFILPSYVGDGSAIQYADGLSFCGLINENNSGRVTLQAGTFHLGDSPYTLTTVHNKWVPPAAGGNINISFSNLYLTMLGGQGLFEIKMSVATLVTISLKDLTCDSGTDDFVSILAEVDDVNVGASFVIDKCTMADFQNGNARFFAVDSRSTNNSSAFLHVTAANSNVFYNGFSGNSSISFLLTDGDTSVASFAGVFVDSFTICPVGANGSRQSVSFDFAGGVLGLDQSQPLITGFDIANGDSGNFTFTGTEIFQPAGGAIAVLGDCPGMVMQQAVGTVLTNCYWSDDGAANIAAIDSSDATAISGSYYLSESLFASGIYVSTIQAESGDMDALTVTTINGLPPGALYSSNTISTYSLCGGI